jgi:hypothetical protein
VERASHFIYGLAVAAKSLSVFERDNPSRLSLIHTLSLLGARRDERALASFRVIGNTLSFGCNMCATAG